MIQCRPLVCGFNLSSVWTKIQSVRAAQKHCITLEHYFELRASRRLCSLGWLVACCRFSLRSSEESELSSTVCALACEHACARARVCVGGGMGEGVESGVFVSGCV